MRSTLVAAALFAFAGCAQWLGLDEGTPREAGAGGAPDGAAPDASSDAGRVEADAGAEGGSPLRCGAAECDAVSQGCCRSGTASGADAAAFTFRCMSGSQGCAASGDVFVGCARPANCAAQGHVGEVCCVTYAGGTFAAKDVACRPPSQCADAGTTRLCDTDEDCIAPAKCQPSTITLVGFTICK